MASRRAAVATASALRAAAARPSVARSARCLLTSFSPSAAPSLLARPAMPCALAPRGARWYSGPPADDLVRGSRIWNFDDVKKLVEDNKADGEVAGKVVIVDVREPHELFQTGKIPGAINIPITSAVQSFHIDAGDFEELYGFERPGVDTELLFYCKAGVRARAAAGLAKHAGWSKVGEFPGSWLDWEANQGPVEAVKNPDVPSE